MGGIDKGFLENSGLLSLRLCALSLQFIWAAATGVAADGLDGFNNVFEFDIADNIYSEAFSDDANNKYRENGDDEADDGITDGRDCAFDFIVLATGKNEGNTSDKNENDREKSRNNNGVCKTAIDDFNHVVIGCRVND